MQITEQDFREWEVNPVTKAVLQSLLEYREQIKEKMAEGSCSQADYPQWALKCQTLKDLAEMDFLTLVELYQTPKD